MNPEARLVAITAPSEASRQEAQQTYPDARIFADPQEMIAQAEFDIIDIATPSHTHREIAVAAMAKGKHVLLEKPMATNLADALRLRAVLKKNPVTFMVGHQ
ncbi:MAG: Gfo/Idh/MocA family oxidoreductase, partial [Prosthecobacter sp.]|nr:Gfo/Idh/MocA family oxidoreductase [Prosthecobacter sp.]